MRAETGPMQFGNDWPGVFIRGDNAMAYAINLKHLLNDIPDDDNSKTFIKAYLMSLADLLSECNTSENNPTTVLKDFDQCL